MKPITIEVGNRVVLIFGSPARLPDVVVAISPKANLLLVKGKLDA